MENLGIQTLKVVCYTAIQTTHALNDIFQDGKVSFGEKFKLLSIGSDVVAAIKKVKTAIAEFKELSEQESMDLRGYIAGEFDLPNESTEQIIEHSLNGVLEFYQAAQLMGRKP